jgi:hypothetical protein
MRALRGPRPGRQRQFTALDATSIIGLVFGAIAAWCAWRTVRLTRQIQRDADLRRLIGALVSIKAVAEIPSGFTKVEVEVLFHEAQAELDRALALRLPLKGTFVAGGEDLQRLLRRLSAADPIRERQQIAADTERAFQLVTGRAFPTVPLRRELFPRRGRRREPPMPSA